MATYKQDIYKLAQSTTETIQNAGEEIRIDLQLEPQPLINVAKVQGEVTYEGKPLPNTVVKVMDENYNPIIHAITGENGSYTIDNHPTGSVYHIYSSATGKLMQEGTSYTIAPGQILTRNFEMVDDPNASLSIIAGDLYKSQTTIPINGAVVSLYRIDETGAEVLEALTYTNEYGQFVFRELEMAEYNIRISALGYNSTTTAVNISEPSTIAPVNVSMTENTNTSRGTVSGVITNNNNQVIPQADVVLYRVEKDGSLTPISFTKTNADGVYLFINVPQGDYKVKSTQADQ